MVQWSENCEEGELTVSACGGCSQNKWLTDRVIIGKKQGEDNIDRKKQTYPTQCLTRIRANPPSVVQLPGTLVDPIDCIPDTCDVGFASLFVLMRGSRCKAMPCSSIDCDFVVYLSPRQCFQNRLRGSRIENIALYARSQQDELMTTKTNQARVCPFDPPARPINIGTVELSTSFKSQGPCLRSQLMILMKENHGH